MGFELGDWCGSGHVEGARENLVVKEMEEGGVQKKAKNMVK